MQKLLCYFMEGWNNRMHTICLQFVYTFGPVTLLIATLYMLEMLYTITAEIIKLIDACKCSCWIGIVYCHSTIC